MSPSLVRSVNEAEMSAVAYESLWSLVARSWCRRAARSWHCLRESQAQDSRAHGVTGSSMSANKLGRVRRWGLDERSGQLEYARWESLMIASKSSLGQWVIEWCRSETMPAASLYAQKAGMGHRITQSKLCVFSAHDRWDRVVFLRSRVASGSPVCPAASPCEHENFRRPHDLVLTRAVAAPPQAARATASS